MGEEKPRPRRRDEQAMADLIGRAITDLMPLPLLMALTAWEEKERGKIATLFAGADVREYFDAFWRSFWREFQAAQAVARAEKS